MEIKASRASLSLRRQSTYVLE